MLSPPRQDLRNHYNHIPSLTRWLTNNTGNHPHHGIYGLADSKKLQRDEDDDELQEPAPPEPTTTGGPGPERATSEEFNSDVLLDERDPRFTGKPTLDAVLGDEIELVFNQMQACWCDSQPP